LSAERFPKVKENQSSSAKKKTDKFLRAEK